MKKLFSLLLVIALVAIMATGAFAASASTYVTVSNTAPEIGDTITAEVGISNNPGFMSGKVQLSYDSSVLTLVSLTNNMFQGVTNPAAGIANHASATPVTGDGILCTAVFEVIGAGNTAVSASVTGMRSDAAGTMVDVAGSTSSSVVVPEPEVPCEHSWTTNYDETHHWEECECGEIQNKEEHTWNWVTDKEATETEAGEKHEECSCGAKRNEGTEIPATGTTEPDPTPEPTVKPTEKPADPEPTKKPVDPSKSPQTGDFTAFVVIAVLCAAAVVVIVSSKKSKAQK